MLKLKIDWIQVQVNDKNWIFPRHMGKNDRRWQNIWARKVGRLVSHMAIIHMKITGQRVANEERERKFLSLAYQIQMHENG